MASSLQRVPVERLLVGDIVAVKSGDKIPVDGVVESGSSSINEANLTGESRPVQKVPGDTVHAGTVNVAGGYLTVRTTALSKDSAVARLVKLVQQAQAESSPTEQLVMKVAKVYTPLVVSSAIILATIPWAFGPEIGMAYMRTALVVLIIACPCALVISTPLTYVCGLAHAARVGILVKGGQHLETLGHVKALALDKTGTLTTGRFELEHLESIPMDGCRLSRDILLQLMLSVEVSASHPMAAAICESCKAEGATPIKDVEGFMNVKGEGVRALVTVPQLFGESGEMSQAKLIEIGNARMLKRINGGKNISSFLSEDLEARASELESKGGTVGWLCIDGVPAAMYSVADSPRPEAAAAVKMLHALNVKTVMLTGDNEGSAAAVSKVTGVQSFHASLLPQDKLHHIKCLRNDKLIAAGRSGLCEFFRRCCDRRRHSYPEDGTPDESGKRTRRAAEPTGTSVIGMVGDGVNDAPALALASVGIAMGATGTVAAMETADVTLMDTDLRKLAKAIRLGRMTVRKIEENIVFSIVSKIAVFIIALAGYPHLWLAIACDVGGMLLVTLNSSSLLGNPRKKRPIFSLTEKTNEDLVCLVSQASESVCQKGCCSDNHGHTKNTLVVKTPEASLCKDECCSIQKPSSCQVNYPNPNAEPHIVDFREESCKPKLENSTESLVNGCRSGCCSEKVAGENTMNSQNYKPVLDCGYSKGSNHPLTETPVEYTKSDCKKGCCSQAAEPLDQSTAAQNCADVTAVTVSITDVEELELCDINLLRNSIGGVSDVKTVEYLGGKSLKIIHTSLEPTILFKILEAVEDMGFDAVSSPAIMTVTVTDAGDLNSCDVNLVRSAIQGVAEVTQIEYSGTNKCFHVIYSPFAKTTEAKIKEAVVDMGFDVE